MKNGETAKIRASALMFARIHSDMKDSLFDTTELAGLKAVRDAVTDFPAGSVGSDGSDTPGESAGGETALEGHRQALMAEIRDIYRVGRFLSLVGEWTAHHVMLEKAKADKRKPGNANTVFGSHLERLRKVAAEIAKKDSAPDEKTMLNELVSAFLPYIPLRIPGSKYNGYLEDGLMLLSMDSSPFLMFEYMADKKSLAEFCNGTPDLSSCAKPFYGEIAAVWNTELESVESGELDAKLDILSDTESRLNETAAGLFTLYDAILAAKIVQEYGTAEDFAVITEHLGKSPDEMEKIISAAMNGIDENARDFDSPLDNLFYESGWDYFGLEIEPNEKLTEFRDKLAGMNIFGDDNSEAEQDFDFDPEEVLGELIDVTAAEISAQVGEWVKGYNSRRKRLVRQFCLRGLPFPYDVNHMPHYRNYFLANYEKLDDLNRKLLLNYHEYFESLMVKGEM